MRGSPVSATRVRFRVIAFSGAVRLLRLCALTLGFGSSAAAEAPSPLRVEVISCVLEESAVDVSEMLAIARAELAPRSFDRREEDDDGQPLLRVDACHDQYLLLRLLRPEGPERRIALHDVPVEQRPRVAALALAELVIAARAQPASQVRESASESEASEAPAPARPAPAPASPNAARPKPALPAWTEEPAPPPVERPRIELGPEARLFTKGLAFTLGPRIDARFARADVGLVAVVGAQSGSLGRLRAGLVALNPNLVVFRSRTRAEVALWLGAEVGFSWGRAQPFATRYGPSRNRQAVYASGLAQFVLSGPLSRKTFGRLALVGGYAFSGVRARIEPDVEVSTFGPFAALSAGLGWGLP